MGKKKAEQEDGKEAPNNVYRPKAIKRAVNHNRTEEGIRGNDS